MANPRELPRCPVHNAPLECPRCSLKAQLHTKYLTASQLIFLIAAVDHCSSGSAIWASVRRLCAYSKLSRRTVQGFLQQMPRRHWLTQLAPANEARALPATYRLNMHAIPDDPQMNEFVAEEQQQTFPEIDRPAIPGERIPGWLPCAATAQGVVCSDSPAQPLHRVQTSSCVGFQHPAQPLRPTLRKTTLTTTTVSVLVYLKQKQRSSTSSAVLFRE